MATLKTGFTYQTGNVIVTELGPLPTVDVTWDHSIPVATNTNVEINTLVNNNILYDYKLPVQFFYTDPETNVSVQIAEASIGIGPNTNTENIVIKSFPQYFVV